MGLAHAALHVAAAAEAASYVSCTAGYGHRPEGSKGSGSTLLNGTGALNAHACRHTTPAAFLYIDGIDMGVDEVQTGNRSPNRCHPVISAVQNTL